MNQSNNPFDIATAAIEAERKLHRNRSSARLAGAALVALRAHGIDVTQVEENAKWRKLLENASGAETLDEAENWLMLSGLSISLGAYGEWGCQTLEMLFDEIGIKPGEDLPAILKRIEALRGSANLGSPA